MIITGYQGIGKSTLAKRRQDIIDLESSFFGNLMKMVIKQDLVIGMFTIVKWQNPYQNKAI